MSRAGRPDTSVRRNASRESPVLPRPSRRSWRPDPAATHLSAFSEVMGPLLVHPSADSPKPRRQTALSPFREARPARRRSSLSSRRLWGAQFGGRQQSRPRSRRDCRNRGIAVTPSREAARSHSRGRSRGGGRCGTGPLARHRLAPRRREITFGRRCTRELRGRSRSESDRRRVALFPRGTQDDARRRRFETRRAHHGTPYWRSASALKLLRPSSRLLPFMRLTMSASASLPNRPPGSA